MVQILSYSEVGGHRVNEDAFVVQPHPTDPDCPLVCLADGQGGQAGGARAAQLACETAMAAASQHRAVELADAFTWQSILARADTAVAADSDAGFATLIGLCLQGNRVVGASCGDSAVAAVCPKGLRELTAFQFKNPPIGSGEAVCIPFEVELARPWRVLVMSDGVWKYAGWERITRAATRTGGQELLVGIQEAARLRGTGAFPDDFTVVLLESSG